MLVAMQPRCSKHAKPALLGAVVSPSMSVACVAVSEQPKYPACFAASAGKVAKETTQYI